MSNIIDPNSEMSLDWQDSARNVANKVGNAMSGSGFLLAKYCKVILTEGDYRFDTVPTIRSVDDVVELVCNVDAYNEWQSLLAEAPSFEEERSRGLFLGIGIAQAELTIVANPSIQKSKELSGEQKISIGKRVHKLIQTMESRSSLSEYAKIFGEKHELDGLEDMVATQLTPKQILRINQLRYGLSVSMYAAELTVEEAHDITGCFVSHLKSDVANREESYYEFLQSFAGDDYDEVTRRQEKIQAYSFPELLFAGTMPMNLFDVLE
jgi:hypothetical protein